MSQNNYFSGLISGVKSLAVGLGVTMKELFTPKITEQYPENRNELKMFDRFRGRLIMPHNDKNEHKCVGCGLCQMACPNDTIKVTTEMYEDADGKKKRRLVAYEYDLGCCMFCELCITACPHQAIEFSTDFENAVFDRSKLIMQLNQPNSTLEEKKPVAKPQPAAPKVAPAQNEAPAAVNKSEAAASQSETVAIKNEATANKEGAAASGSKETISKSEATASEELSTQANAEAVAPNNNSINNETE